MAAPPRPSGWVVSPTCSRITPSTSAGFLSPTPICRPGRSCGRGIRLPARPSGSNIGEGHLRTQVATVGTTYLFSPTFLYDGLFGWTRQGQAVTGFEYGTDVGSKVFGIPGTNGKDIRESGAPEILISGYTNQLSDADTRPFLPMVTETLASPGTLN